MVLGIVGGLINIAVGMVCLREAAQALKNGDRLLGTRLLFDALFLSAIGLVMILVSISAHVAALAGISAFLTANPWLLPLLFFALSIPLTIEIGTRISRIWSHRDIASTLNLKELEKLLKKEKIDWNAIKNLYQGTALDFETIAEEYHQQGLKSLSNRMEVLQADMGVKAAIETFKLFHELLCQDEEKAKEQLKILKERVTFWNRAQHVRLFQQVLYFGSFALSMLTLRPKLHTPGAIASQNFGMALANGIPLWMDSRWPFERNTTLVIPQVAVS